MRKPNEYIPQSSTHPGVMLAEKLDELRMSQKEFALRTDKPEQTIIKVMNGDSSVTADMAIRFENVLKIPARFWMNLQQQFDEAMARQRRTNAILVAETWTNSFPYAKMVALGWVPPLDTIAQKTEALFQFFGVSSHKAWESYYFDQQLKVSFRISLAHTNASHAIAAWLRQGEIQAEQISIPPYQPSEFKKALPAMRELMVSQPLNFFEELKSLCTKTGVAIVYTPNLPNAPIHGATRWLKDTPLIQLSARYKRNDIFWFTFFHEAGHILKHGKKYVSLENISYQDKESIKEKEADDFSKEWTFPEKHEIELTQLDAISEEDILKTANKHNTHPGIILGRLQHKKVLPHGTFHHLFTSIDLMKS